MYALAKFFGTFSNEGEALSYRRTKVPASLRILEQMAKLLLEAKAKRVKLLEEARAKGSSFFKKLRKVQASLRSLEQRCKLLGEARQRFKLLQEAKTKVQKVQASSRS